MSWKLTGLNDIKNDSFLWACLFCKVDVSDYNADEPHYSWTRREISPFVFLKTPSVDQNDSFPPSLLDDLLEGCLLQELSLAMVDFMKVDILTSAVIYDRANRYHYKGIDAAHKVVFKADFDRVSHSLYYIMSFGNAPLAKLTFLRMFSILFEEFLPENETNSAYEMLMLLKEIMEICLAPVVSRQMVYRLAEIVKQHNSNRKRHFKEDRFIKANHNLEHYAIHLLNIGPLNDATSLHFEKKHAHMQQVLDKNSNEPDFLMRAAVDHAKSMQEFLSGPELFKLEQPAALTNSSIDMEDDDVRDKIKSLTNSSALPTYLSYDHRGVKMVKGETCVLVKRTLDCFLVGKVKSIVLINDEPYVIFAAYKAVLHTNRGFHNIHPMGHFDIVKLSALASQVALPIYSSQKGEPIITLFHAVPISE